MSTAILRRRLFVVCLLCRVVLSSVTAQAAEPHWIRVSSSHFSLLTDAEEKRGREVAVRLEQMRSVFGQLLMRSRINLPEPLEIIALASHDEYAAIAPARPGQTLSEAGFLVPGEDRNYIALDLSQDESWRAVSYGFGRLFLNYNYPPTQEWFDEGFADYFSSLWLSSKQAQIGGDPGLAGSKSFVGLLTGQAWRPITELFSHQQPPEKKAGLGDTLFAAQSWIVMHYLLNKNKLEATGTYFDLTENQRLPVEQAIQKAFGMTSAQLEQAVKDYFLVLVAILQAPKPLGKGSAGPQPAPSPTPAADDEIASSTQSVLPVEARALLAEMSLRLPERREQALKELQAMASDRKLDNAIAHRGLAWAHMQKNELTDAVEELGTAAELDPKDPWLHYYLALVKYHAAQASGQQYQGLANMLQDLRVVLDWNPEFAEAYNMLGMARVEGGGTASAMEAMRAAIRLNPRNETYLLNMAKIYMAAKQWQAAIALLQRLAGSQDPIIASAAHQSIADLPTLEKYGVLPQHETAPQPAASRSAPPMPPPKPVQPPPTAKKQTPQPQTEEADEERSQRPLPEPQPDRRPIQFLKGRLVAVDCSQAPVAVLTVSVGAKFMKLRTADYKSMTLVGADEFSCEWTNRPVAVNYKAGGMVDGDLVSLELR